MIEKSLSKLQPAYSPALSIPVRDGKNVRFHEALLWELGLGDLVRFADLGLVFPDAIRFLKYRGTLYAMKLALKWVGFPVAKIIKLSRTTYEIDPGKSWNDTGAKAIQSACRNSAPASATLLRIFHLNEEMRF